MIHVVWNERECGIMRAERRACYTENIFELLTYLGLAYQKWSPDDWADALPTGVTLLVGEGDRSDWAAACGAYCREGNVLLAIGGLHGTGSLFGVRQVTGDLNVTEGWVEWGDDPLAEDLQSSFHFFGGCSVEPLSAGASGASSASGVSGGSTASAIDAGDCGPLEIGGQLMRRIGIVREPFPALLSRRVGRGRATMLAVDLMQTFCLIQQGVKVVKDGAPAPDGTGAINDNILKADDACVLDWGRDRDTVGGAPFYLHPIVDEWRILFMRLLHQLFTASGHTFGQVWLWPGGLSAIGHISHDTDRNIPEQALNTLDRLADAGVKSTWCIIMPGYDESINRRIAEAGHEVALHYNALGTEMPQSQWKESHFKHQYDMLRSQFPDERIVTNKNHYLRWEGDYALLHWCERQGLYLEQSRGGTKQGNKGFLTGTSHPFLTFNPDTGLQETDVVSLTTLSWDPPFAMRCTEEEALALTDRVRDVYGVAHFLFHPYLVGTESTVGAMLVKLVEHGRQLGMDWWTGAQILDWFRARRQVQVEWSHGGAGQTATGRIIAEADVDGVTILLAYDEEAFGSPEHPWGIAVDNGAELARVSNVLRFGCKYKEIVLEHLHEGVTNIWLTR
ncbi:hypothetical protein [Paenibacillus koleovorans]|uniref:hypothetical protein n=1 Tax=Paenibacillus koleovorans TaxID=121608 RepID=UPI000FD7C1C5|nr:hypothetical protein [Paenibacillus koleovorans]